MRSGGWPSGRERGSATWSSRPAMLRPLSEQIVQVKAKWGLSPETPVVSCYEAGRDSFWLQRQLVAFGIANQAVDAASIEVSRRARRAKTDRLDAGALLEKLIRHAGSERWVWRVVRVPDAAREDLRQLHREREDLLTERTRHRNRLSSKLVAQGIRFPIGKDFLAHLEAVMLFDGSGLPAHLKAWVLVMELFGWRALTNRRQLASLAGWSHRRTTGAA